MITSFFWCEVNDMEMDDIWFQQDGAICHTENTTVEVLHEWLSPELSLAEVTWITKIVRFDSTSLFLLEFSDVEGYANKQQSADALKVNITQIIAQIQPDLCVH